MDHLAEAKNELEVSEGAEHHWQQLYLQSAQAHALIAIAERLDRLIESQVCNVPVCGELCADRKIDFGGE